MAALKAVQMLATIARVSLPDMIPPTVVPSDANTAATVIQNLRLVNFSIVVSPFLFIKHYSIYRFNAKRAKKSTYERIWNTLIDAKNDNHCNCEYQQQDRTEYQYLVYGV
jgi:hypothetical protein